MPWGVIQAVGFGLVATAIGFACGSAARRPASVIPTAEVDRGSGLLATASRRNIFYREPAGGARYGGSHYGGDYYGYDYYGGWYYGDAEGYGLSASMGNLGGYGYGGRTYGGMLYGNYQFVLGDLPLPTHPLPRPYLRGYYPTTVVGGGAIEGRITWPQPPAMPASLPLAGDDCPTTLRNPSVVTDPRGNLANAVVYLEGIASGRRSLDAGSNSYSYRTGQLQVGGAIEARKCQLSPHIQLVAPIGSTLEITNNDTRRRTIRARRWGAGSRDLIFSTTLAQLGKRYPVRLDREGFIELRSLEPGEVTSGWVVVAGHPYYAITDRTGRFRLDEVPAGTYQLVVWHEPVITGTDSAGRPEMSPPIVERRKVTVKARRATTVNVALGRMR